MNDLDRRLQKLEARSVLRLVSGISAKLRRSLTDRAVLHGDQDVLEHISAHRSTTIVGMREQRDAAVAAGLRADN